MLDEVARHADGFGVGYSGDGNECDGGMRDEEWGMPVGTGDRYEPECVVDDG